LTRARDVASILSAGIIPTASYDLDGIIDQSLARLSSDSNADGGTVSSSSGILEGGIYNIIEDNNTYTYNGGTV
jgi:hypothetical protein